MDDGEVAAVDGDCGLECLVVGGAADGFDVRAGDEVGWRRRVHRHRHGGGDGGDVGNGDAVEAVVHLMPVVLPAVGAAMMLLLAFIAVYMA